MRQEQGERSMDYSRMYKVVSIKFLLKDFLVNTELHVNNPLL